MEASGVIICFTTLSPYIRRHPRRLTKYRDFKVGPKLYNALPNRITVCKENVRRYQFSAYQFYICRIVWGVQLHYLTQNQRYNRLVILLVILKLSSRKSQSKSASRSLTESSKRICCETRIRGEVYRVIIGVRSTYFEHFFPYLNTKYVFLRNRKYSSTFSISNFAWGIWRDQKLGCVTSPNKKVPVSVIFSDDELLRCSPEIHKIWRFHKSSWFSYPIPSSHWH